MSTLQMLVLALAAWDIAPDPMHRKGTDLGPGGRTAVAMEAESVQVTVDEDTAAVRAVFTLRNTSDQAEELEVGFPNAVKPGAWTSSTERETVIHAWNTNLLQEFRASVDGEPVKPEPKAVPEKNIDDYGGWLCWSMHFEPGQTRRVEVSYRVVTRDDSYTKISALRHREVAYILKTGAGWHGPIGSAEVVFDLGRFDEGHVIEALPAPTVREPHRLVWRWKDFEPEADVVVRYRVFKDAEEAVERLAARARATDDFLLLLDYAENLEAAGRPLEAARVFQRLHAWECRERKMNPTRGHAVRPRSRVRGDPLIDGDHAYVPPAMRAASNLNAAGLAEEASSWAALAIDRWQEVRTRVSIPELGGHYLQKSLRIVPEFIGEKIDECREWIGSEDWVDPWEARGRALTATVDAAVIAAEALAGAAGADRWEALRSLDEAGTTVERALFQATSPVSVPPDAILAARAHRDRLAARIHALSSELVTDAYDESVPWRDLLAPDSGARNPWTVIGAARCDLRGGVMHLEFLDNPKGEPFGRVALDGWTVPWHDFVFEVDLEMSGSGYGWSLDFRYRPAEPEGSHVFHGRDPSIDGVRHRVVARVRAADVSIKIDDGPWNAETVRPPLRPEGNLSGGVAFGMLSKHRMTIRKARLKLLR